MPWNRVSDLDSHWNDLAWKFERILDGQTISQEDWFLCFTQVFQLLTSVDTDSLDKVHEKLYSFFKNYLIKLAVRIKEEDDSQLLRTYRASWSTYRENLLKISQVFGTLLFEPYKSSSMLPSALYLPSLSNNSDDIQSDAEISSVYDIGVLYWQNVVVKPMSDRLLHVLMDSIKLSWQAVVSGDQMDQENDQSSDLIVDVALTFSQRPGELFAAIRGLHAMVAAAEAPPPAPPSLVTTIINPANLLGPLLAVQSSSKSSEATTKSNATPACAFVLAYQRLLKEFAVLSQDLDVSNQSSSETCRKNLTQLSRFISSENERINKIFGQSLAAEIVALMEELFFGGARKNSIEKFLAAEATQRGLCQDVACLFAMISVLPSGRKMAINVLAQYISGLSKIILDNRPADVASSPESFVSYFGGQLMQLRKTVEVTFSAQGMSESLSGAVVRAAEEVLAKLSSENLCPEDFAARYIDIALKRCSSTDPNNPEFQKKLDSFVGIFTYLTEKTLYQKYHAKLLFRRLVFGLSPSLELERAVHRCMAEICSSEYCVYLNRTIAEVERSVGLSKDYAASIQNGETSFPAHQPVSKLSALILSQHIWPLGPAPVTSLRLPNDFQRHIDEFTIFFGKKKERAKLTWMNGYATAEVRLLYPSPKPVTLVANMAYVVVLFCFADADSRTASSLAEATGLALEDLTRVCSILIDQKLLTSTVPRRNEETIYSLNLGFTSRHPKLRLLTLAPATASASASSQAPATPKPANLNSTLGDTSMDLDQSRGNDKEPIVGRAAFIEKLVIGARDHVTPQVGFTCMDLLRCILAHPELTFTPSPNEIHLCLQRLAAIGTVVQLSHNAGHPYSGGADNSHAITYKFA